MAIALAAKTSKYSDSGNTGFTSSAIDTTGANLLILFVVSWDPFTVNPSDSKGNTWQALTRYGPGGTQGYVMAYYAYNPTVGASHTFSWPSNSEDAWPSIFVLAYSGMLAGSGVYDASNGDTNETSNSVTPAGAGELIISGYVTSTAGTPAAAGDFAEEIQQAYSGGVCIGGGVSAQVYAGTSAIEATWTPNTGNRASNIIAFKPAATATALPVFMQQYRQRWL
jgi:hypothetical protein